MNEQEQNMTTSVYDLLRCPVCGLDGETDADKKRFYCHGKKQHSFDFAKSGYLNLCLSAKAGDLKEAVRARSAFLEEGYYLPLSNEINSILSEIAAESVLDAGCGEGYYTKYLHSKLSEICNISTCGVDISKYAVIEACKGIKKENLTNINYAIANINRLPILDEMCDILLNCFAPIDDREFCDIAKKHKILVVPGSSFACPGYVRMAYCVSYEMIQNSRKVFELYQSFLKV